MRLLRSRGEQHVVDVFGVGVLPYPGNLPVAHLEKLADVVVVGAAADVWIRVGSEPATSGSVNAKHDLNDLLRPSTTW